MNDDLISRQAAIKLANDLDYESSGILKESKCREIEIRYNMIPPAQPERKTGKWIDEPIYKQTMDGKTWDGFTYCSECKEMHEYGYRSKFCPNCGADMEANDG